MSIRVSDDERAWLKERAGDRSINAYVKERIFKEKAELSPNKATLAKYLAELGASDIAPNLRTLARCAEIGAFISDQETRDKLNEALSVIIAIRAALIEELKR